MHSQSSSSAPTCGQGRQARLFASKPGACRRPGFSPHGLSFLATVLLTYTTCVLPAKSLSKNRKAVTLKQPLPRRPAATSTPPQRSVPPFCPSLQRHMVVSASFRSVPGRPVPASHSSCRPPSTHHPDEMRPGLRLQRGIRGKTTTFVGTFAILPSSSQPDPSP